MSFFLNKDFNADGSTVNVPNASTTISGIVKLNNTLTSNSITEAVTAAKAKELNDQLKEINSKMILWHLTED